MSFFYLYSGLAGFLLGVFSRSLLNFGLSEIVWILSLSLVLGLLQRRKNLASSMVYLFCVSLFLLCFALGAFRMEFASWSEHPISWESQLNNEITKEGKVVREPEFRETSTHVYVQSEGELLLLTVRDLREIHYGDVIQFAGQLRKPEPFATDLGRTFNYPGYLHAKGVNYMVPFATVEVLRKGEGNVLLAFLFSFKQAFMANIERAIPSPHAGLSEGLLLGVKQALGESYEEAFVKTGITHIVVLSGYNIMLVTVFVMYLLSLFLPFKLRLWCGLGAIVLFALLVGLSATVVRASIMACFLLIAKLAQRTYDVVRSLIVAGVLMICINPYLLVYDVGFQLSFLATLGLILLSSHLEKVFSSMPKIINLREFLVATVAAQIFVMPILLYQIGAFSVVAVLVNLIVLPMVPVAMFLSFVVGMVGFLSFPLSQFFGFFAYWSLAYILHVAVFFAQLPFASFVVPAFPFVFVIISYALLGWLLFYIHARTKRPLLPQHTAVLRETSDETIPIQKTLPIFFR